jgi:hypothetical protein
MGIRRAWSSALELEKWAQVLLSWFKTYGMSWSLTQLFD